MRTASHRRWDVDEAGFTLIELMVVVLIVAILLAIALSSFLGARTRTQDRAAQSNLRNALTAEKTFYTDQQQYTVTTASLTAIEPSVNWLSAAPTLPGQVHTSFLTTPNGPPASAVVLEAKSASGKCFTIMDETATGAGAPGTWYQFNTSGTCTPPATAPQGAALTTKSANNIWGNSF